jgi:hypothetical protein
MQCELRADPDGGRRAATPGRVERGWAAGPGVSRCSPHFRGCVQAGRTPCPFPSETLTSEQAPGDTALLAPTTSGARST